MDALCAPDRQSARIACFISEATWRILMKVCIEGKGREGLH
jgi:hypothetical protein